MARGPGHRPLILLRWILLGLFLVAGTWVLRIYLARDTTPPAPRSVSDDPGSLLGADDAVTIAHDFEYEVIEEGITLFVIRAERMVSDREDRFVLEGVELQMEDEEEEGQFYTIACDQAIYELESRNAILEGAVVMSAPNGVELAGEAFELENGGRVLESTAAPISFRLPGAYAGTAVGVRINVHLNTVLLRGDVAIESAPGAEPPLRLTAARMLYQEAEALLRSEGGVVFTRGNDELRARRLSATFDAAASGIGDVRFVQGRWEVSGRLTLDSSADRTGQLEFEAGTMGVAFDDSGKGVESVVLEGEGGDALLRLEDGTGLRQVLRAESIHTSFVDGAVSRLETFVPSVLEEGLARDGVPPLRRLCGDALVARLSPEGGLAELDLDGSVDYRDARLAATGDRLSGDPESRLTLSGRPARLLSGNDDVEAPEIVYSRGEGSLLATGGVRATGLDRSGVELASGDDRAPVLVTAERATWSEDPPEVAFLGKVRAWQGESFLLADQLRVLDDGEHLMGQGAVKTVWRPPPGEEGRRPIEVNAGEFHYRRQERRLDYSQDVRAHEAGRTVRCDELEILMDAERRIESLFCEGKAEVDDPVNGRKVRGSEALYTPGDRMVLITGAPVVLEQRDGTEMEGRRLRYDLETGAVEILSEPRSQRSEDPAEEEPGDG